MKTFQLNAEPRTDLGKKAAKGLRKQNLIPVVLNGGKIVELDENGNYAGTLLKGEKVVKIENGRGIITTDLVVRFEDIRKLVYTPDIFVIELTFDGQTKKAVLKDLQFHPVNDSILHIDLLEVFDDKPVVMAVPVHVQGFAVGVKAGGKLYLSMKKVKVKGLYKDIPETLTIDVTPIEIDHSIKVGDLQYEGLEMVSAKELVVTGVRSTRAAAAAETEEAAEGEEAAE